MFFSLVKSDRLIAVPPLKKYAHKQDKEKKPEAL